MTSPLPPSGSAATASMRPLALELAQDRLVRPADHVGEHVEPAAVRHADHDLVGARLGRELDRLVEHRDHRVQALDRELLLAEEGPPQVLLEALDLGQPREQALLLVVGELRAVAAGLDRVAQPDPLLVVRDVLDLVRDRAAVDLLEPRQDVGERLARNLDAEQRRRDLRLQLGRERRLQHLRLERRVADRLGAERVEAGGEMAVRAVRLHERHRRGDAAEQRSRRPRPEAPAQVREPLRRRQPRCGARSRPPRAAPRAGASGPGARRPARCRRSRTAPATRQAPRRGSRGTPRRRPAHSRS